MSASTIVELFETLQTKYQQIKNAFDDGNTGSKAELNKLFDSYESTENNIKNLLQENNTKSATNLNDYEFDNLLTEIENESKEKTEEKESFSEEEKATITNFSQLKQEIKAPICEAVMCQK